MQDELWHHGILGMHWGHKNGPPYPLSNSQKTKTEKEKSYSVKWRNPSSMTTTELQDAISRMRTEQEYKRMYEQLNPKKKSVFESLVSGVKKNGPSMISKNFIDPVTQAAGKKIADSLFGDKEKDAKKNQKALVKAQTDYYKAMARKTVQEITDDPLTTEGKKVLGLP